MTSLFTAAKHAQLYAKFRPLPPDLLIEDILRHLQKKILPPFKTAVDIGCGSGQSTSVLAPHFESIIGVDISKAQIKYANEQHPAPNISYKVSSGEGLPLPSSSVQLATFGQSAHWFDAEQVFGEVRRVLVRNGVVAVYGYWIPIPRVEDEDKNRRMKELVEQYLHEEQLGIYWDKERYIVQNRYSNIHLPFEDIYRQEYVKKTESSLSDYIGYFTTWSSYQKLHKEDPKKAELLLQDVQNRFLEILDKDKSPEETTFTLYTDYFMLMGYK